MEAATPPGQSPSGGSSPGSSEPRGPGIALDLAIAFSELDQPHRYKVYYGGRGAAKSHTFARALLVKGTETRHRILCTREFQVSIRDSVHKLLKDLIAEMGLGSFYAVTQASILGRNGTEFIFAGLKTNVASIKSTEGITIAWVEEAERVSEESWQVLIPTVRQPGSEIWVSFNTRHKTDPTYKRFVTNPPPGAIVRKVGHADNPWFPAVLKAEMEHLYAVDPDAAAHVWGGEEERRNDAQILGGRWLVQEFEPKTEGSSHHDRWGGPYYGNDWGFAQDPTVLVKVWVDPKDRRIYVEEEAYGVGVENHEIPQLFDSVSGARDHVCRADNARPETISQVKQAGYGKLVAVEKWPGSVEDGIRFLRSYTLVVHPRCKHTVDEFKLYSYKVDRLTGDVLPIIVDKFNHCVDALRYALAPLIRASRKGVKDLGGFSPDAGHHPRDTA